MSKEVCIVWFRRDLRLIDNTALNEAVKEARKNDLRVLPLFIFDTDILSRLSDPADARVHFIHETVLALDKQLRDLGGFLCVKHGRPQEVIATLTTSMPVSAIYTNRDYEPYALKRDEQISKALKKNGIALKTFKDHVIFENLEVAKKDGTPYTVFSAYAKKWRSQFSLLPKDFLKNAQVPIARGHDLPPFYPSAEAPQVLQDIPSLKQIGFVENNLRLVIPEKAIDPAQISVYHKLRNFPSEAGTSRIGVHLRFGTLGIRQAISAISQAKLNEGSEVWMGELIWREFFIQILANFPHVVEAPFKPAYAGVKFHHDKHDFEAWCTGKTGYPIVDAGMRELNATGFMHNRVRMITASFLVKHLLIDWRWGEAYFASKLLDFELASNNGNWQWVAGCGCDAAPYFRVFNPAIQEKKFDHSQRYLKSWIPELNTSGYPEPIIEHVFARERAIRTYAAGLGKSPRAKSHPKQTSHGKTAIRQSK